MIGFCKNRIGVHLGFFGGYSLRRGQGRLRDYILYGILPPSTLTPAALWLGLLEHWICMQTILLSACINKVSSQLTQE